MKTKFYITLIFFTLFTLNLLAQISPPGLGKAKAASWFAVGLKQKLDTVKSGGWESMTYAGIGRKSNTNNTHPYYKPAILVFNQEFYNQFHKHWQTSFALSYRRQDEYIDDNTIKHANPAIIQEFRAYGRMSYILKSSYLKFVPTFRAEFRKFFTPDFKTPEEDFQIRTRFRLQLTANLDKNKIHKIITSSEQLFAISKESIDNQWTDFKYKESRFGIFYSYSTPNAPFVFDIGYVNNLIGSVKPHSVHYLALDVVVLNPF